MKRPTTNYPRSRVAMLADLTVREWVLSRFETGKMAMLENGTPITSEIAQQWREELRELRRLTFPPS
jgi:hypothetical protein